MIAARALVRNVAATEQDWNTSINTTPGTEFMCVNDVRHTEPHISGSSCEHPLHKVKCYNFSELMEKEVSKVVYTAPPKNPNMPPARASPKPARTSSDKSTRKSKEGK